MLLGFFQWPPLARGGWEPVALLDALVVPETHVIVGDIDNELIYRSALVTSGDVFWRIGRSDYAEMSRGQWSSVANLVDTSKISPFGEVVRSSILAFSQSLDFY